MPDADRAPEPCSPGAFDAYNVSPIPVAVIDHEAIAYANDPYRAAFGDGVGDPNRRVVYAASPLRPLSSIWRAGKPVRTNRSDGGCDHFYSWCDGGWSDACVCHVMHPLPEGPAAPVTDRHFRYREAQLQPSGKIALWLQDITAEFSDRLAAEAGRATGQALIDGIIIKPEGRPGHVPGIHKRIVQKEKIGGDFFFARHLPERQSIFLVIGDSAGKDVKGALTSAIFGTLLQQIVQKETGFDEPEPALTIIESLDEEFRRVVHGKSVTVLPPRRLDIGCDGCVCVFDLAKKQLSYASGNFPLWRVCGQHVEHVGTFQAMDGKSIGFPDRGEHRFVHEMVNFSEGTLFFAASDGVYEGRARPTPEHPLGPEYGRERFAQSLANSVCRRAHKSLDRVQGIIDDLYADLCKFRDSRVHEDDVLILGIDPFSIQPARRDGDD